MAMTTIQRAKLHPNVSSEFRTPDLLAKRPLIGVMIVVLGLLIFSMLAYAVYTQGPIIQWDNQIENRMHAAALNSPAWIRAVMIAGYYIGLQGYVGLAVLMGLYFLFKRFWKEFLMVAIGSGGQALLWLLLVHVFHRDRPVLDHPIGSAIQYPSFPSGHTMSGVVGFGLLAYILVPRISSRLLKAVVAVLAFLLMVYIGFSRFFMGAHYASDVAAGLALGFAWAGLVFMSIELLFQNRKKGEIKNGQA